MRAARIQRVLLFMIKKCHSQHIKIIRYRSGEASLFIGKRDKKINGTPGIHYQDLLEGSSGSEE
jgi:hypothetical protein